MKRAAQRDPGNRDSAPIIILLIAADRAEEWKRLLDQVKKSIGFKPLTETF